MRILNLSLALALILPWTRDNRPCPQCDCGMGNWRSCSVFCYTRDRGDKTNNQRSMTKMEKKTCFAMCPKMCERPKK